MRPGSLVRTKLSFADVPQGSIGLVVAVDDTGARLVYTVVLAKDGPARPIRYGGHWLEEISNR